MIRLLKIRFVTTTVFMVSLVLIVTFGVLLHSSSERLKSDSYNLLDRDYSRINDAAILTINPPANQDDLDKPSQVVSDDSTVEPTSFPPLFTFFIGIDANGDLVYIFDSSNKIDTHYARTAVESACKSQSAQGVLRDMNLRYKTYTESNGVTYGFTGISQERSYLVKQIRNFSLILTGSLIVFLIISLQFAKRIIKPVSEAWSRQRQFIADASHELKTPLSVINASTSILLSNKSAIDADLVKWIDNIDHESGQMQALVNDMLFLARVDSGQTHDDTYEFDLSDSVCQSSLPFEALMFDAKQTLKTFIDPDIRYKGNQSQIKQLIAILLDNAQKYSTPDTVITLKLSQYNSKIFLTVNSYGAIIPENELSLIFDRFHKVNLARTREDDSYGLGLAIAKEIVTLHKGTIKVQSSREMGTTFKVIL